MRNQVKLLVIFLVSSFPFLGFANVPSEAWSSQPPAPRVRWAGLLEKLLNNRMPQAYYDFLAINGIFTREQMINLDEDLKIEILKMYREDLNIMSTSAHNRSIF